MDLYAPLIFQCTPPPNEATFHEPLYDGRDGCSIGHGVSRQLGE